MEIFPKKLIIAVGVISVFLSGYFIIFGLSYGPILTSDGEREIAYAIALRELNFNIFRYSIDLVGWIQFVLTIVQRNRMVY